jgi:DNA-binding NarL/FixJ family response regulator
MEYALLDYGDLKAPRRYPHRRLRRRAPVAHGHPSIDHPIPRHPRTGHAHDTPEQLTALTAREREVMVLAAEGKSNTEIAHHLVVSPLTVRTHIQRAMTKLHARDRAQLVVIAYQTGLIRPQSGRRD